MAGTVRWEQLRGLAGFRAAEGCAVSLYLNLDPREAPTAADVETRQNSLLSVAERLLDERRRSMAHTQREALKGPRLEKHLDYWRRQLADLPEVELQLDHG